METNDGPGRIIHLPANKLAALVKATGLFAGNGGQQAHTNGHTLRSHREHVAHDGGGRILSPKPCGPTDRGASGCRCRHHDTRPTVGGVDNGIPRALPQTTPRRLRPP